MVTIKKHLKYGHRKYVQCMRNVVFLLLNLLAICLTASFVNAKYSKRQNEGTTTDSIGHQQMQIKAQLLHPNLDTINQETKEEQDKKLSQTSKSSSIDDKTTPSKVFSESDTAIKSGSSNIEKKNSNRRVSRSKLSTTAIRNRIDWETEPVPQMCKSIKEFPQPLHKNCSTAQTIHGAPKCDPSRPMMFAQYGEDYFLYTRHFVHMKKPGVYLDIASNHPISISNTYFMDRCLGWSGICVEANSKYFEPLHRERSCALVPTCVSAVEGESVEFILSGPGSGIVSTHRQGSNVLDTKKLIEKKKCVTVGSQLKRYGVKEIDYFNLDVEGGELNALQSINWDEITIKVISVEISIQSEQPIQDFLTEKGFLKIDTMTTVNNLPGIPIYPSNRFYVHSSGEFGKPW